jgi:O-methyltransferase involved in polyketide biosynthesis
MPLRSNSSIKRWQIYRSAKARAMTTLPIGDFDKISPTARLVAYFRQFSDIPYTQQIATLSNATATVNQFVEQEQKQPVMMAALIEARYKAIEQVSARFNHTQILELASGLLPRGMIRSENPEVAFIESDLSEMIQQKQQMVRHLIGDRPNLHFLAINATDDLHLPELNQYFQPDRPVTILCEGLLMYLTLSEKQRVFANVRVILQAYGGVWITSDFTTKAMGQMRQRDPTIRKIFQKIASSTGRTFAENEFDDLDHAKQFAQAQGFKVEIFSMVEVLDQLKCLSVLGIDLDRVKAMLSATPVFTLTLP